MFDTYSVEILRQAALTIAAMVTLNFTVEFRSINNVAAPGSEEVGRLIDEALSEAEKLEDSAEKAGKRYYVNFCRLYHPRTPGFYSQPMTRAELALMLLRSRLRNEPVPEPVVTLLAV